MKLMKWNEIKYSINYIKYVSNKNNEKTKLRTIECYFLIFMDNWMNNFYMIWMKWIAFLHIIIIYIFIIILYHIILYHYINFNK